jgi:hypothetical protein
VHGEKLAVAALTFARVRRRLTERANEHADIGRTTCLSRLDDNGDTDVPVTIVCGLDPCTPIMYDD